MSSKIKGSYYLKSTRIQKSQIAHQPPHYREVWDLLIRDSSHTGKREKGITVERGQCLKSYKNIQDDLHWMVGYRKHTYSINSIKNAVRWLKNKKMIKTKPTPTVTPTATPLALLITVIKLHKYQNPANYEYTYDYTHEIPNASADDIDKNSLIIYDYYIKKVRPYHKSKIRAIANIKRYLKKFDAKSLSIAVANYAKVVNAENRPSDLRKDPANFFGIREKFFIDYLPENFKRNGMFVNNKITYQELDLKKIYDNPVRKERKEIKGGV